TLSEVIGKGLTAKGYSDDKKQALSGQVQQGIWSGVAKLLGHPTFQKVVGQVVGGVLTPYGIGTASASNGPEQDVSGDAGVQHAISNLGSGTK
ncbi:hypothetical protein H0H81_006067, partial [Sphagnurus paluster]